MKNKTTTLLSTALLLVGYSLFLSGCKTTPSPPAMLSAGSLETTNKVDITAGTANPCPGAYQAKTSDMRNNADGSLYQKMPAGKTNFLAVYLGPTNNIPVVFAMRKSDLACRFGTNSLTWSGAIAANAEFKFRVYWKQSPTNAPAIATNLLIWMP
jgi:hypothetical protein